MCESALFLWEHSTPLFSDYGRGVPLKGGLVLTATIDFDRAYTAWTSTVCIHKPGTGNLREEMLASNDHFEGAKATCEAMAVRLLNHPQVQSWLAHGRG